MANVKLQHISKSFEYKTVLNDIDLSIENNEFCVLLGPSGCGKSTLLRIIAGLEMQNSGDVLINDKIVNNIEPKNRDIAFVFQSYALYPHLNVYENIAFPLKIRKLNKKEIDEKVNNAIDMLDLTDSITKKPKELSGGQRQRVALGRAIVRDAKVFLMDEPLSNLDAKLRSQMRSEIKALHKKLNTTFIYVTHDQVEALTMGDKIVVLKDGIIQQKGTPNEIYKNPDNTFVAQFVGNLPMNLIEKENEIIGFRPEDVIIGNSGDFSFKVLCDYAEILGSEKIVKFKLENNDCFAKLNADTDLTDLTLSVKNNKIYHFDKKTKKQK